MTPAFELPNLSQGKMEKFPGASVLGRFGFRRFEEVSPERFLGIP
jgi:hypothetical protein